MSLTFVGLEVSFSMFSIGNPGDHLYIGLEKKMLKRLRNKQNVLERHNIDYANGFDEFSNLNIDFLSIGSDGIALYHDENGLLDQAKQNTLSLPLLATLIK
jgi:hypothetical protein